MDVAAYNPVVAHGYPKVTAIPPFPFSTLPPLLQSQNAAATVDPYIRSAVGLSYTRTLELLRRHLGPHFELEKLWEKHTYYVSPLHILWWYLILLRLPSRNLSSEIPLVSLLFLTNYSAG